MQLHICAPAASRETAERLKDLISSFYGHEGPVFYDRYDAPDIRNGAIIFRSIDPVDRAEKWKLCDAVIAARAQVRTPYAVELEIAGEPKLSMARSFTA